MNFDNELSPVNEIFHPVFDAHQVSVFIKRDDLIHPIISGNKWRKLAANIEYAKTSGARGIVSFGGSFSNHLHALAYACHQQGLPAVAIIRGEPCNAQNYTLAWAQHWNMQLHFVDRQTYRLRQNPSYLETLKHQYPGHLIIPEGGTNELALLGVGNIITELRQQANFDTLMLPVGSGGTIAGLIKADNDMHQILGVLVLKGADYLNDEIAKLSATETVSKRNWQLLNEFHGGGYAKFSSQQLDELAEFSSMTNIPFEPIYSGKMIHALLSLMKRGYFPKGHRIMLLHTGGLQGLGGLLERKLITPDFLKVAQWHLPPAPLAQ